MKNEVLHKAEVFLPEITKVRRHLHQYPELSFNEIQTAAFIARFLEDHGIRFQSGVAGTGLVATLEGRDPGSRLVALRADMDALPIEEQNQVEYRSQNPGVMHACGHDVHTACLLGTLLILHELRDQWSGTIRFIFQPGEEKLPGGASLMIAEGVLENPVPEAIFGQHVFPSLEAGKVGFRAGMYMASADELYMTIRGKGGHGATPHLAVDPIAITAQVITALQQVVSRMADPTIPSVLTFGKIQSDGGTTNVIPDSVYLEGTFRTFDEGWRELAHEKMQQIARSVAEGLGGQCELRIEKGYPVLLNNESLTLRARQLAVELLGPENVVDIPIRATAKDFAFYTHHVPGCFYRLGTRNESRGIVSNVHTPTFDVDESALQTGMALMAWLAARTTD